MTACRAFQPAYSPAPANGASRRRAPASLHPRPPRLPRYTETMALSKVGVAGCGLMGSGIAEVCARAGFDTAVLEVDQALLDRGMERLRGSLGRALARNRLSQEAHDAALNRLHPTTRLEDLRDSDVVIEAIIERVEEKRRFWSALDKVCPPATIFLTNTSSLTVIELAAATTRMDRFAGLHFFNPAPVMKLVEVIRTIATSQETVDAVWQFTLALGKEPVLAKDTTGFIVNRLLVPYLLDAIRVLEQGTATAEDIDKAMVNGCGYPMGPFALLDLVGLDTTYYVAQAMFEEFKEPRFASPPLLRRMVLAGRLGRKSGEGFYKYT